MMGTDKKGASIVNIYSYTENEKLKSLCFKEMTEEALGTLTFEGSVTL